MRVPGTEALWMLSSDTGSSSVRSTKHDRNVHFTSWHIESLGSGVDDVINGLHWKVEGHELANGAKTGHSSAGSYPSKSHLCDWCVNNSLVAVLLPQSSWNLNRRNYDYLLSVIITFAQRVLLSVMTFDIPIRTFRLHNKESQRKFTETCCFPLELTL